MKTLPSGLAASLASGTTTLCRCWIVTRVDGAVFGFTDHDRPVTVDGVTCEADSGMTASTVVQTLGLAVDTVDVAGALSADGITEEDLAKGFWDRAAVRLLVVDWQDPTQFETIMTGSTGDVRRGPAAFSSELRSIAHALGQPRGRRYGTTCDAEVGDARCGVDLTAPAFRGLGTVTGGTGDRLVTASGLDAFAAGWFARGRCVFTSGAADGVVIEVKRHTISTGVVTLEFVEGIGATPAPGDSFAVTAGCDKAMATCATKFANVPNFRGFPHMPGADFVTSYPNKDDGNDGESL